MEILLIQTWIVLVLFPVTEATIVTDDFTRLDRQIMTGHVVAEFMARSRQECALKNKYLTLILTVSSLKKNLLL